MAENPLAKKLKLTGRQRSAVVNAPAGYAEAQGIDPASRLKGRFDWIQIFVRDQSELRRIVDKAVAALESESILWVSFPKGSSRIQTDLTRDKGWESLKTHPLMWITLVSVDETWSAFALRPLRKGEKANW